MYNFGSGSLFGAPTDASAPVKFGILQEVSLDFQFNAKELHGQKQFAVAVARGSGKVQCKAKAATINGATFNSIFFGQSLVTGRNMLQLEELAAIPATPFSVTVSQSTHFQTDLGVTFAVTGIPLVKVASTPTTGQYSVSAGVYTFAAADTLLSVRISYTYTDATNGKSLVINNQLMGVSPFFSAVFGSTYNGKSVQFTLNRCMANKLTFATKLEDFTIPELDFSAFVDDGDVLGTLSFSE